MTLASIVLSLALTAAPSPEELSQNQAFWLEQLKSESADLRINAIDKLAELGSPSPVQGIASALKDPVSDVRYHALRALTHYPTEETLALLQQTLSSESDPYLVSETKRSIKAVEDAMKAAVQRKDKEQKKKDKAAKSAEPQK